MWISRKRMSQGDAGGYISPLIKWLLFGFNILFWAASLVAVGIASWALATKLLEDSKRVTSPLDYVFDITIILLVVAIITFLVSFCGCLGSLRENIILLQIFAITLLLIFLVLLILGIVGLAVRAKLVSQISSQLSIKWIKNYEDDPDLKDVTDFFQEELMCCGISDSGYLDWNNNPYYQCDATASKIMPYACSVPYSCCNQRTRYPVDSMENRHCGYGMQLKTNPDALASIYTRGCVSALVEWSEHNVLLLSSIVVGTSVVPLFGIALSIILISQIKDQIYHYRLPPSSPRRTRPIYDQRL